MAKEKALPHLQVTITQLAVEGLIKGNPNSELLITIQRAYPDIQQEAIEIAIKDAMQMIRDSTLTDIDKIIPQHVEIYEQIYAECEKLRYVPGKLKAMRSKERLLGLLKETNYVEIHNELNIEIEREPEYDLSKLNPVEQGRFEALMKKVVRQ